MKGDNILRPHWIMAGWITFFFLLPTFHVQAGSEENKAVLGSSHLHRAKIYLAAGDYRRAVEACQRHLDEYPSVEGYVYLAYVYQTIEGYLEHLSKKDEWVKVGQLSLNLGGREVIDLIDPPNVLSRMAREIIHEGIRQQFDVTAAMANRLDKDRTDQLWTQQTAWREAHPDSWWAGVPEPWGW